ncbi:MAG: AraC family transcriptional regulator [Lachnospiraceae bacterium]|nr:AraC family transcriptional regulator [Lachnospiraceae bacterium]
MYYDDKIEFLISLLDAFQVPCQLISSPKEKVPSEIDCGLRGVLFGKDTYRSIPENFMDNVADNTIYRYYDQFFCRYILLKLPDPDCQRFLFVGPYLEEMLTKVQINTLIQKLNLPEDSRRFFALFYEKLPVINDENWLLTMAQTLGKVLWKGEDSYRIEYIDYMIPDQNNPVPVTSSGEQLMESVKALDIIEEHYRNENQLMEAVSKGQIRNIASIPAATSFTQGTEPRLLNPLRNRKNYLIILNTILRKSAEMGGVHPLHIDKLSALFSRKIENLPSLKQSLTLQEKMIREYCQLVRKYSLKQYSYYVGRAITLIHYDLTADLSLKSVSAQLNVNPSYFSNLFRKEIGCTYTDYVNRQRIDRALILLKTTNKLVQDISADCGFSDTNYFIRLFKKNTGQTPSQYRESTI